MYVLKELLFLLNPIIVYTKTKSLFLGIIIVCSFVLGPGFSKVIYFILKKKEYYDPSELILNQLCQELLKELQNDVKKTTLYHFLWPGLAPFLSIYTHTVHKALQLRSVLDASMLH